MSRTFSTNSGSVESLKVSARCGCRPKARQMRWTLDTDMPEARAMPRELQWVAPLGVVSRVFAITASMCSSPMVRGVPERGSSWWAFLRDITNRNLNALYCEAVYNPFP
jgi:hypothetical protein